MSEHRATIATNLFSKLTRTQKTAIVRDAKPFADVDMVEFVAQDISGDGGKGVFILKDFRFMDMLMQDRFDKDLSDKFVTFLGSMKAIAHTQAQDRSTIWIIERYQEASYNIVVSLDDVDAAFGGDSDLWVYLRTHTTDKKPRKDLFWVTFDISTMKWTSISY